jgi:hypothetical protein
VTDGERTTYGHHEVPGKGRRRIHGIEIQLESICPRVPCYDAMRVCIFDIRWQSPKMGFTCLYVHARVVDTWKPWTRVCRWVNNPNRQIGMKENWHATGPKFRPQSRAEPLTIVGNECQKYFFQESATTRASRQVEMNTVVRE